MVRTSKGYPGRVSLGCRPTLVWKGLLNMLDLESGLAVEGLHGPWGLRSVNPTIEWDTDSHGIRAQFSAQVLRIDSNNFAYYLEPHNKPSAGYKCI